MTSSTSTPTYQHEYNEQNFRQKIQSALNQVDNLLNHSVYNARSPGPSSNSRKPVYFADYLQNTYDDKFGLAEYLTNVAIASQMNVLDVFGVDEEKFRAMHSIANSIGVKKDSSERRIVRRMSSSGIKASLSSASLSELSKHSSSSDKSSSNPYEGYDRIVMRLTAEESCAFHREELVLADAHSSSRDVQHNISTDIETSLHGSDGAKGGGIGPSSSSDDHPQQQPKRKEKNTMFFRKASITKDKVTEYHWKVSIDYSISVLALSSSEVDEKNDDRNINNTGGLERSNSNSSFNSNFNLKRKKKPPPPLTLQSRKAITDICTIANSTCPLPAKKTCAPIDVDMTWLFQHISSEDFNCNFTIDRSNNKCLSPRRNVDIEGALKYFTDMASWCNSVCTYFLKGTAWSIDLALGRQSKGGSGGGQPERRPLTLESISAQSVFIPVLPLFEPPLSAVNRRTSFSEQDLKINGIKECPEGTTTASPLLPIKDVRLFLNEQCRTLDEKIVEVTSLFPPPDTISKLVSSSEATIVLLACHSALLSEYYLDGIESIEELMRSTLIKVIGSEVNEVDFVEFSRLHEKKLFKKEYGPKPFLSFIRMPKRFPEGFIGIESIPVEAGKPSFTGGGAAHLSAFRHHDEPIGDEENSTGSQILTVAREIKLASSKFSHGANYDDEDGDEGSAESKKFMRVRVSTSVNAYLSGKCFLHGWTSHQFRGHHDHRYQLVAKARQFSSFLLMVGSITSPQCFEPKDAIIIQNKDELVVPLILGQVPSSSEYDSLMSSLCPTHQRFAKSARDTQLESSVFGVCVIDIRPQLELLLGLPLNSLTKEVRLTEQLVKLFVDHQIPSDLLEYDGPEAASKKEKLDSVKENASIAEEMAKDTVVEEHDETVSAEMSVDASAEKHVPPPRPQGNRRASTEGRPPQLGALLFPDVSFDQASHHSERPQAFGKDKESDRLKKGGPSSNDLVNTVSEEHELDDDDLAIEPEPDAPVRRVPSINYLETLDESERSGVDVTSIPRKVQAISNQLTENLDETSNLRPAIIQTADVWSKRTLARPPLNVKFEDTKLGKAERKLEKRKAMDLVDALSRSGSLPIQFSEIHAIVGVTHCFEKSLMDTVIVDNTNPVETLSHSTLLVASAIHGVPTDELVHS